MKTLLFILFTISVNIAFPQSTNYSHCNCTESISETGSYKLTCNGIKVEEGQYIEGKRENTWTTRNNIGTVIIKANFKNDKLDGPYAQFHYNGDIKLKAHFVDGYPQGDWTYYNDKGKVVKVGRFENGMLSGTWNIYDRKGKNIVYAHNDHIPVAPSIENPRYFKNSGSIARDDESGEWMILYFPDRTIESKIEPVGGFLLAGDFFVDDLNIPLMFMNTYVHYEFIVKLDVAEGKVSIHDINISPKDRSFSPSDPSFPFIVQTNSPGKLTSTKFSEESIKLLKNRIKDTVLLNGPWITNGYEGQLEIQIPFVLNDIRR